MRRKEMTCKEIFRLLSEYLDGELDAALCQSLKRHMQSCKPCEAFINTLRKTIEICCNYKPDIKPKIRINPRVREKLRVAFEKFAQKVAPG